MKGMMKVRYFSFSDFSDNCAQPVENVFRGCLHVKTRTGASLIPV